MISSGNCIIRTWNSQAFSRPKWTFRTMCTVICLIEFLDNHVIMAPVVEHSNSITAMLGKPYLSVYQISCDSSSECITGQMFEISEWPFCYDFLWLFMMIMILCHYIHYTEDFMNINIVCFGNWISFYRLEEAQNSLRIFGQICPTSYILSKPKLFLCSYHLFI